MKIGQAKVDFNALLIESEVGRFPTEAKIMAVLRVLADNANQVVSREELIDTVWGVEFGGDERLTRAISILRKAFGDSRGQHTHIETVPRRGYRLIAEVGCFLETIAKKATEEDVSVRDSSAIDGVPRLDVDTQIARASLTDTTTVQADTISQKKKRSGRPVLAALAIFTAAAGLWLSPIGKSISGMPDTAVVDTGLTYVKNFTEKDAVFEAQDIFARILADNPDHAAARAGLALALMREYTHLETDPILLRHAKSAAEASLRLDPNLALANIAVGWAAEFEGDYEKAHKAYDRADILDPGNVFNLEGRIRTYHIQGLSLEVQKILDQAINLHPDYPLFFLISGERLMGENNYVQAEAMFRKAISLSNNKNPRAYAQLASCLHLQDRSSEAISTIQEGLKINETALLYSNLGTLLFFQGHYEMSAQAFEQALAFEGNSHDYLFWANLADAYRWIPTKEAKANEAYDRALQLIQAEIDKHPTNPRLNSRAALYHAKSGNLVESREVLSRVPLDGVVSANEYYRAVITYDILSERDLALTMLERALKAGYPLTEILNDPELADLRQNPNYHRLLSTLTSQKEIPL